MLVRDEIVWLDNRATKDKLPKILDSGKYVGDYEGIKVVKLAMCRIAGVIDEGIFEWQMRKILCMQRKV